MKESLEHIQLLQDTSRQIEQLRRDAEMLDADEKNRQRVLQEMNRRAEQARQQRLEATKLADATQLQIEQAEGEIARLGVQLNVTKHQKEYDAIQHSILSHRADIQKWEDEELTALQTVDDLALEEKRLAEEVGQAEQDVQKTREDVAAQKAELKRRVADLDQERQRLRQQVSPAVLSAYERLTGRYGSRALVEVKNRICQGCFTRITKQTENLLMRNDKVVYCHSCGRMLVLGG
ncbi:MAG: zinc ribbon domain-containing protein [Planctomycetota bacterium]|jgi:predicted  nucleic acid-binding Zn-ribbon protein